MFIEYSWKFDSRNQNKYKTWYIKNSVKVYSLSYKQLKAEWDSSIFIAFVYASFYFLFPSSNQFYSYSCNLINKSRLPYFFISRIYISKIFQEYINILYIIDIRITVTFFTAKKIALSIFRIKFHLYKDILFRFDFLFYCLFIDNLIFSSYLLRSIQIIYLFCIIAYKCLFEN